ncbi:MAG: hypothetical protein K2K31_02800 [Clostridia bacterium]|nr:hypothetical protein [Clostridia bacterium]
MEYKIKENGIEILGKEDFNSQHILECGQIFSYEKSDDNFLVFSTDKKAKITETDKGFFIETEDPNYFVNFFDLKTDYSQIKKKLEKFSIMKRPIVYGYGIRILKQDLFETLISFIVSANNNIKRIQMILNRIRQKYGTDMGDYHAFPTRKQLLKATEQDFAELGAGYRAKYLYNVLRQIDEDILTSWQILPTDELRNKLISLSGVGPKVADCVLLFGFGRGDVFPVDTWIHQMYNKYYTNLENREKIRQNLVEEFGLFSGYAQQYLFFFMRAGEI